MKQAHEKNHYLGPGGISCSCCRVLPGKKATRVFLNRVLRHSAKIKLKLDIQNAENY